MSAQFRIRIEPNLKRQLMSPAQFGRLFAEAQREVAAETELIFGSYALKGPSGRLTRGIYSYSRGDHIIIAAEAKAPNTGYDYVAVTRFGHRGMIQPVARGRASMIATGKARGRGRTASLRFVIGGKVLYRRSTKGFHPTHDWAELALPAVQKNAQRILGKLAKKVEVS